MIDDDDAIIEDERDRTNIYRFRTSTRWEATPSSYRTRVES